MTEKKKQMIRSLGMDYRTGRIGRGVFKRRIMRLGWSAWDVQMFEREHEARRKQIVKRASQT